MRLYKDVDTTKATMGSSNRAQAKVLGRLLWLSVETVVILHETVRRAGFNNVQFVELPERLHNGACTSADYALPKTRSLTNLTSPVGYPWKSGPIIVSNNAVRDTIGCRATKALRRGRAVNCIGTIQSIGFQGYLDGRVNYPARV